MEERSILEVIKQITEVVGETSKLGGVLAEIETSVRYTAPEIMWMRWDEIATAITLAFKPEMVLNDEVALKVVQIFTLRTPEEIKQAAKESVESA